MHESNFGEFPSRIVSRLAGGGLNTRLASLIDIGREEDAGREDSISKQIRHGIKYLDCILTFEYIVDFPHFLYIHVDKQGNEGINLREGKINEVMKDPLRLIKDPLKRRRSRGISHLVSDGRFHMMGLTQGYHATIEFKVNLDADKDAVFDSFWLKFRPLLLYLKNPDKGESSVEKNRTYMD